MVVGQTTQDPVMVMPVDENVHINLTSSDVIHGFYVQAFNFSRYALPGVLEPVHASSRSDRHVHGQCTQLCGLYHSLMFFRVKVVTTVAVRRVADGPLQPQRRPARPQAATEPADVVDRPDEDPQERRETTDDRRPRSRPSPTSRTDPSTRSTTARRAS